MASRAEVLEQITDIAVRVLACNGDAVTPNARFSELGSDSLTIVEIGEELGRRFEVYLSDDMIDSMRTVQDAVDAVLTLTAQATPALAPAPVVASTPPDRARAARRPASVVSTSAPTTRPHVKRRAIVIVSWMTVIGVLIGGAIGFGMSAMVSASGISDVSLPPINATTPTPTPSATTPAPKPTQKPTNDPTPKPTLNAEKPQVAPGERFVLSGAFPTLSKGVELQVQVREPGIDWDDFPVTTATRADGRFKTQLYTSRTGPREFRLINPKSGEKTPTVKVQIG